MSRYATPDTVASSVVYLLAVSAVVALTPMTVLRFARGDTLIGLIDIGIIAVFVTLALCRWLGGWARWQGIAVAVSALAIGLGMVAFRDTDSALWMFPSMITLFFVLPPTTALIAGLLAAALSVVVAGPQYTAIEVGTLFITLALVDVFVFVFSNQLAAVQAQLDRLASEDPLTGLNNRRELEIAFSERPHAPETPVKALLVFDLDHFKEVNDLWGHDVGDTVLRRIAGVVLGMLPSAARAFRYGGEEFVVLLNADATEEPSALAERLRERIAAALADAPGPVTASFGCVVREVGESLVDAFNRADEALYRAKSEGRNRVVCG